VIDRVAQIEKLILWLYRLSPGELRRRLSMMRPRVRRSVAGHWMRGEARRLEQVDEARARLPTKTLPLHVVLDRIAARLREEFPHMNRGGCGIISRILLEQLVALEWDQPSLRYVFPRGSEIGLTHVLLRLSDGHLFDTDYGVHHWSERFSEPHQELRVSAPPGRLFIFEVQASEFTRNQIRLGIWTARSYEHSVEAMRKIVVDELSSAKQSMPERRPGHRVHPPG
jgi:hypothetical protein